jgi:hypothetical protein
VGHDTHVSKRLFSLDISTLIGHDSRQRHPAKSLSTLHAMRFHAQALVGGARATVRGGGMVEGEPTTLGGS